MFWACIDVDLSFVVFPSNISLYKYITFLKTVYLIMDTWAIPKFGYYE
jgi:hypothetical protein